MGFTYCTKLVQQLFDLSIIDLDCVELFSNSTRDDPNQTVWRCKKSGVIFLEPREKLGNGDDLSYWGVGERGKFLSETKGDDDRRFQLIYPYLASAKYLDIGTGLGGILDRSTALCEAISAVEPQYAARKILQELGYQVYADISELEESNFDLITLFHVFEHLHDPMLMLKKIREKLKLGGTLLIEVPHANDALLTLYKSDAFKQFTLWSEHLVLHTQKSITAMLESAGFAVDIVQGEQRYSLANHQYWLSHGKPGGHNVWRNKFTQDAQARYRDSMIKNNLSDTLIVTAQVNAGFIK